ncbi:MAG: hypothetical protein ABIK09_12540 [Pseudomonadota bacterium]
MRTVLVIGLCLVCLAAGLGGGWWFSRQGAVAPAVSSTARVPSDREAGTAAPSPARPEPPTSTPVSESAPCSVREAPPPCPRAEAPAPCPACPSETTLCVAPRAAVRDLTKAKAEVEAKLAEAEERLMKRGPAGRYDDPTVQGRRRLAAEQDNLLLEFPSWGDDFALSPKAVEKHGLSAEDQAALEQAYGTFQREIYADLRELLVELTGDPSAGENSTLNALIHDVFDLSPRPLCRERMLVATAALAAGTPLPAPGADAPACELLILSLYEAVDRLDGEIRSSLGDAAAAALWSGTSTFEFSNQGSVGDAPPEP